MPTLKGVKATPWLKIIASLAVSLVVCLSLSMFRYELVEKPSSGPCGVRGKWRVLDRWSGKVTTYPRADFEQTQGVLNRWTGRVDKAAGAR